MESKVAGVQGGRIKLNTEIKEEEKRIEAHKKFWSWSFLEHGEKYLIEVGRTDC